MIYLASPYSDPDEHVRLHRFQQAAKAASLLIFHEKQPVFSPIVYGHALQSHVILPTDAAAWEPFNSHMLTCASRMMVLTIEGWDKSIGVQMEIDQCSRENLLVEMIDPRSLGLCE